MTPWKTRRKLAAPLFCAVLFLAQSAFAQQDLWPDLSEPAKAVGGGEKDAAVIVGAENYAFVEPVAGAKQNARDWQAYLTGTLKVPLERVALLQDDDATVEEMRDAAAKAAAQVEAGGTLWFVFIGHGAPSKDGKDGLLVGVDAQQKAQSIYARSFSRNELLRLLAKGKQAKTVALIDACFSGKSSSGANLVAGLQPLVAMRSLPQGIDNRTILLTAGRADQFAGPLPDATQMRPAFSYLALGALRGWAADARGKVTAQAVVAFARKALWLAHDRTQTPELAAGAPGAVLGAGREPAPDLAKIDRERGSSSGAKEEERASPSAAKRVPAAAGKAGIEWVTIPGGKFTMGSHDVLFAAPVERTIKSFQIAKTEVTNKQYKACVDAGACTPPSRDDDARFLGDDQPVVNVDWDQAVAFSKWVGGRLPSEAEWEYAARSGGKARKYPWGDEDATCDKAVINGCAHAPMPVCSKPAGNTEQGLCDMAGNVSEWVQDMYADNYVGTPVDGRAWEPRDLLGQASTSRVNRGGSFGAFEVRAAARDHSVPNNASWYIGIRPAR